MTQRPDLPTYAELRDRYAAARLEADRATRAARDSEVRRLALEGSAERLRERAEELERQLSEDRAAAEEVRQELAEAQGDVQRARRLAAERQRDADQAIGIAVAALRRVRDDLDRVEGSTAWRLGHGAARALTRIRLRRPKTTGAVAVARERIDQAMHVLAGRRGEQIAPLTAPGGGRALTDQFVALLGDRIRNGLGALPSREQWPAVTIVVRLREGRSASRELLQALSETDYPALELIVAGLGAERLDEVQQLALPFEVRAVPGETGGGASWNQAAAEAQHPLLLFLDAGLRPVEPGWLKELVDCRLWSDGVVSPTVLSVMDTEAADEGAITVARRGLVLNRGPGVAQVRPAAEGEEVFGPGFGIESPRGSVSAGCLLLDREVFARAGGFDTALRPGSEDVALSFSVIASGGRVACSGRAFVLTELHDDSEPGDAAMTERWGPALWRELRLGLSRREPWWTAGESLRFGIVRVPSDDDAVDRHDAATSLGESLSATGAAVTYLDPDEEIPGDLDVAVALSADFDPARLGPWVTAVGWIRNDHEAWIAHPALDRYDILLAATGGYAEQLRERTGRSAVAFAPATDPASVPFATADEKRSADFLLIGSPDRRLRTVLRKFERAEPRRGIAPGYAAAKLLVDASDPDGEEPLAPAALDALAAGTLVLSANVGAARDQFDDRFPVFNGPDELASSLQTLLGDSAARRELALRYRRSVLGHHTYVHRATHLRQLVEATDQRLSFALKIGAPDWEQAARWGDLHLARDLQRALKRSGHRSMIQMVSEWDEPAGLAYDVAVQLRGRSSYSPRPGQFNVLWLISHPSELSEEEAAAYDLVCVASARFATELSERLPVPVAVLDQATDPWRFFPDPDPALAHDLVFVGNSRGARRQLLDDLLPTEHDLAVWGKGLQELVDERHLQGEWFPNEQLRRVYSSAKVVLCDHWEEMRTGGFASNRLYDAVASGAVVVSDELAGLDERFGDAVVTYRDREQLQGILERLLADAEERTRRTAGARERVLAAHTFDHRAQRLLELVDEQIVATGHRLRVAA